MITQDGGQQQAHRLIQLQNVLTWDKNRHTNPICCRPSTWHHKQTKTKDPALSQPIPQVFLLIPLEFFSRPQINPPPSRPSRKSSMPQNPHLQLPAFFSALANPREHRVSGVRQPLDNHTPTRSRIPISDPPIFRLGAHSQVSGQVGFRTIVQKDIDAKHKIAGHVVSNPR